MVTRSQAIGSCSCGYRVLPLVLMVALITTVLDVREVVYQLGQAHAWVALLAIGVALSHLATVLVAGLAWREGRRRLSPIVA
jgi:cytochrome b561